MSPVASVRLRATPSIPPTCLTSVRLGWEHMFVPPPSPPPLAREEIEQLRRSIAMLQPGSMAMKREDAMRLLSELGEVRGRLDGLCDGLRALLAHEDTPSPSAHQPGGERSHPSPYHRTPG